MLDQSFSAEAFRRIYDLENRRGLDVAGVYFPSLETETVAIHDKVNELRKLRVAKPSMTQSDFDAAYTLLRAELKALKHQKSVAIDVILETVSDKVLASNFKVGLTARPGPGGKTVYALDGSPGSFFVIKQLQRNVHKIYGVKQSNRTEILQRLRDTVASKFPFEVVRTDISSFYETIDAKKLMAQLDDDHLLSSVSKKFIAQILYAFHSATGTAVGVPRGVGISAYLAELYLRPVDRAIRAIPGLVLYGRYVDDIVAVFARPPVGKDLGSYSGLVTKALSDRGLTANPAKTKFVDLGQPGPHSLSYLGYDMIFEHGKCQISPSANKVVRYEKRMEAAFDEYDATVSIDPRRSYRQLVARVKFLCGNTRLSNSKSSATTGIYFNNFLANDISALAALDAKLKAHIRKIKRPNLRARLKPFSFVKGFTERRYHNMSARELAMIVKAWKHG